MHSEAAAGFISRHRLVFAIGVAVIIGLIMTAVSMSLYVTSGAQVLDLSRPGYENARDAVNDSEFETDNFSQNGPVTEDVVEEFEEIYSKNRKDLNQVDDFSDPKPLSDQSLHLIAKPAGGQ